MTTDVLTADLKGIVIMVDEGNESGVIRTTGYKVPHSDKYAEETKRRLDGQTTGGPFEFVIDFSRTVITFLDNLQLYTENLNCPKFRGPNGIDIESCHTSFVCIGEIKKYTMKMANGAKDFVKYKLKLANYNATCAIDRMITFSTDPPSWKAFEVVKKNPVDESEWVHKSITLDVQADKGVYAIAVVSPLRGNLLHAKKTGDKDRIFLTATVDCIFVGDIPIVSWTA